MRITIKKPNRELLTVLWIAAVLIIVLVAVTILGKLRLI